MTRSAAAITSTRDAPLSSSKSCTTDCTAVSSSSVGRVSNMDPWYRTSVPYTRSLARFLPKFQSFSVGSTLHNHLMSSDQAAALLALHHGPGFVLPNAWDAGSARILEQVGFPAIATTSAGIAWSLGVPDGGTLDRDT